MTTEQAKALRLGDLVYYPKKVKGTLKVFRLKVNGQPKTWVRSPDRVKVPIKYGLYEHDYITEKNCAFFHHTEHAAIAAFESGYNYVEATNC